MQSWLSDFAGYRHSVTKTTIEGWLSQFGDKDRDLAARILDAVDFYDAARIGAQFRSALSALPGWSEKPSKRVGQWRFAPYSSSSGQSGDAMIHHFRLANRLDNESCDDMFIYRSEIERARLGPDDTLVFVDDLTASGAQVCETWTQKLFEDLVVGIGNVYLVVVLAGKGAKGEIRKKTKLRLVPGHILDERDDIFSTECKWFSESEKKTILDYCERADPMAPKGFGQTGYVLVFQHRCPDSSIPLLHVANKKWTSVFPRHD
jgi:hypothetical protein